MENQTQNSDGSTAPEVSSSAAGSMPFEIDRDGRKISTAPLTQVQESILHSIPLSAPRVAGEIVTELALCEVPHLFLRPGQLYRFVVRPGCDKCAELAAHYAPGTHGHVPESWARSGASNTKVSHE
jgi:hypothetical protein